MPNFIARLFNRDAEKALAKQLVEQVQRNLSPKLMSERRQVLSAKKISRLLEQVYEIAKDYQTSHGLGMARRAMLANNFRWELKSCGYPDDFIDVATEGLVVELSKKKTVASPKER